MFHYSVDIFLTYYLRSSVCIINMIVYFLSSVDSDVGPDVFKTVVGYFKSLTIMMISSGFWNY